MTRETFGVTSAGETVERLTIAAGGLTARILTRGAILQDLRLAGTPRSLTPGSESLADYEGGLQYHGPIVGPVANRIAGAAFSIGGDTFHLTANEGPNTLHGGAGSTHDRLWQVLDHAPDRLSLGLHLADGDGGFPGNREITATFTAAPPASLTLAIRTRTDRPTLVNLTNHSYWRLGPPGASQVLTCPATRMIDLGPGLIPTGRLRGVAGTKADFRTGRPVGAGAYDLCLCLAEARRGLSHAATLTGGGLALDIGTTETGLQIHDGAAPGAIALEAQNWPGAAHQPHFPTDLLLPGEIREQITRWRFRAA